MNKLLTILPAWLWAPLLLFALAAAAIEHARVLKARTDVVEARKALADEQLDRNAENTRRALAALKDLQRVAAMQADHAKAQQENVNVYEKKLAALDSRRRAAAGDAEWMRQQFTAFASRDRGEATADAATCQRIADRAAILGSLAARGAELLRTGRIIVEQREAELEVLLETVKNDRALIRQ